MPTNLDLIKAREAIKRLKGRYYNEIGEPLYQSYSYFLERVAPERIREMLQLEEGNRKLVVEDVDIDIPHEISDYDYISKIKDQGGDLVVPVRGSFALFEDGKLKERSGPRLIAKFPFPTREGNFVLGGMEYNIRRQLRLSPGVYVNKGRDGRTHAMLNTGAKQSADVYLDPESSKFTYRVGNRAFPMDFVLDTLGVPETDIKKSWGTGLYEINHTPPSRRAALRDKLYSTMFRGEKPESPEEATKAIRQQFLESTVDPWVTNVTLGKPHKALSPDLLLETTDKMLGVARGDVKPDNREGMHFKVPFDIGMMVNYAMEKASPKIQAKLKQRLRDRDNIDQIVSRPINDIGSTVYAKFNQDELSHTPDQYNPYGIYADGTEITLMGEGGLRSSFQITDQARDIADSSVGVIDPLHSPEGAHLGVNMHLSNRARIYGNQLFVMGLTDTNGKEIAMTPRDYFDKVVALSGQIETKDGKPVLGNKEVDVLYKGELTKMPASKVNVIMGGNSALNFGSTAFIPFFGYDAGNRVSTRQLGQAVPLVDPDAPLVRAMGPGSNTVGRDFWEKMNPKVPGDMPAGIVTKVAKGAIYIRDDKGNAHKIAIREDYQLNGDASITDTPIVQVGERVVPGQVVAENNFSRDRELAIGKNLDVAFVPYHGYNFEDGLVLSESAAKKMTSAHSYRQEFSKGRSDIYSLKKYMAHYPNRYTKAQIDMLDDDGVVKPGMILNPGDPIALKMTEQELTEDDLVLGRISSAFKTPIRDDAKTWDGDFPATVKKVVKTGKGMNVVLSTQEPLGVGDKLSGYHGQRGVVTMVVPDEEMPKYEDGTIPDVLQNPAAVPSRMNTGQVLESMAARIARHTGQPYTIDNFKDFPNSKTLRQEMGKLGLGVETPDGDYDVERRLTFPDGSVVDAPVFSGPQYFVKLKQLANKYYGARGRRDKYDVISRKPIGGSKADPLGFYALLAHGATENLKEIGGVKSEKNDKFWQALETGEPLPSPQTTFAMDKLVGLMRGAGINIREEGSAFRMMPLTDADTLKMSKGEVKDPTMAVRIEASKGAPVKAYEGGLFDQQLFGGLQGENYGHITLATPLPNPMFEGPVKSILDLKEDEYEGLITGEYGATSDGSLVKVDDFKEGGGDVGQILRRGEAFRAMFSKVDIDGEMSTLRDRYKTVRKDERNKVARKIAYLNGLRTTGLQPTDYLISKVPVIPPKFRPVYLTDKNDLRVSDITNMYKKLGMQNEAAKSGAGLPEEIQRENFMALYNSVKGLQIDGHTEPYKQRHTAGILEFLKGSNPKSGHFMSSIFSKRESIGGHGTIMPDPKLGIDDIKIPDDMAWTMLEPFVMRRLHQMGVRPLDAAEMIKKRDKMATGALDAELETRPIMLTRDPKLHKHNYLAFNAQRHPGKAIYIPSLVCKGFNADFDGDRMIAHVPIGPKAVKEARDKMMPSQNLYKYGPDNIIMQPSGESIAGLYAATRVKNRLGLKFTNTADIEKAYEDGTLKINDGVMLGNVETTPGRVLANKTLPNQFRDYSMEFTDGNVQKISQQLAEEFPGTAGKHIQAIKTLGDDFATRLALSFRSRDFDPIDDKAELEDFIAGRAAGRKGMEADLMSSETIKKKMRQHLGPDSILAVMADSGAKGSWKNIQQMLYSPGQVEVASGGLDPNVIRRGYAQGLSYRDYISAARGARKGMKDKGVETAKPGEFSKQLLRSSYGMLVQQGDTDEPEGLEYPVGHRTVLNRYLARDVVGKNGQVLASAGQPVSPELVNAAKKQKIQSFTVRSPLTSNASQGIYAKDFGRLPGNKRPQPGTDLGIISAHTLTEQSTQTMLKKFHSAGAAGAQRTQGFEPVWKLLMGHAPEGERASLAPVSGQVRSINQLRDGGYEIDVNGQIVKATSMPLRIKAGATVKKGDQLQEGYPDPQSVLQLRGHRALQTYLVDEIENNFDKDAPDRRYIEAVVANVTKYAEVDDPGDSDFVAGSVVPVNNLTRFNEKQLKQGGAFQPAKFKPVFIGIGPSAYKTKGDWASSMMFGHMAKQLPDMAASGAVSEIHGTEPIMPYIHSTEFGDRIERGEY